MIDHADPATVLIVIPLQQTTKVNLIVDMKTANVLGLTLPITRLGRANAVIE